ncbi:MAG: hypothetical protein HY645_05555 [Acidobacteria bacterium]|nr:hypothetical protein [Acidobacteriota bacterium]
MIDRYTFRARLQPALLVALPLGLTTMAWFPAGVAGWDVLWGLIVWSGGTALLAQIGRDGGKKKEPRLFEQWGGKPSTRLLRNRDAPNKISLARYHQKLGHLLSDLKIPTPEKEDRDPQGADEVYEACVAFLLEKTRDRKQFPLVFEENCNYGFRRNLWGMKPLGIAMAISGTAAILGLLILNHFKNASIAPTVVIAGLGNLLLLLGWLFWFTPPWVRMAADAYAARLLAACEKL